MTIDRRTARQFLSECRKYPQNAKLFSDSVLIDIVQGPPFANTSPRARALALSELAVRQMLKSRQHGTEDVPARLDVMQTLRQWIGTSALADFRAECEKCGVSTDVASAVARAFGRLAQEDCYLAKVDHEAMQEAFRPWMEADGIIPVCNNQDAYLLPFSFEPCAKGNRPEVVDKYGNVLEEWTEHYRSVCESECSLDDGTIVRDVPLNVRVAFHQNAEVRASGNSMMLPVLMALWRRRKLLPMYNPLRFIATGAYEGARLGIVDTEKKISKVVRDVDDGLLIRPGGGNVRGEIPVGICRQELLERIRALAEESWDCEPAYAVKRLELFDRLVREQNLGDWKSLCERLDHAYGRVDEEKDPDEYLLGLMLRSAARCHAGMTEEAHRLNEQAMRVAEKNPRHLLRLWRLQIEELVLFQDEENFGRIFSLAPDLKAKIEVYAQKQGLTDPVLDLLMRYEGTMGQFLTYAALSGVEDVNPESARQCLQCAYEHAQELWRRSRSANGEYASRSAYANWAQDANYCLLWAALFDRTEMPAAFERSMKRTDDLRTEGRDERGADKNYAFCLRNFALGLYRAALEGDVKPLQQEPEVLKSAESGKGWVAATACKYMGAVMAGRGEGVRAANLFLQSDQKMQSCRDQYDGRVLRVIHMTIRAEAYRSLRRFGEQADLAGEMRRKALEMFESAESSEWHKEAWKKWLVASGDDASFPGIRYWY